MSFGCSKEPSFERNLKPLNSGSLCDAVIMIPASALKFLTAACAAATGSVPRSMILGRIFANSAFISLLDSRGSMLMTI